MAWYTEKTLGRMQRVNIIGLVTVAITAVLSVGAVSAWKTGQRLGYLPAGGNKETSWLTLSGERVTSSQLAAAAKEQEQSLAKAGDALKKAPFTALYLADLPPETPNSEVLSKEKIEKFAEAHLGETLPALPETAVLGTVSNDPESIKRYFATVFPQPEGKLHLIGGADITAVLQAQKEGGSELRQQITRKAEQNMVELTKMAVPSALLALHTQYAQAATALLDSLRLLATAQQDPVAGLIAQKQLERLGPILDDLNHQLQAARAVDYPLASPAPTL